MTTKFLNAHGGHKIIDCARVKTSLQRPPHYKFKVIEDHYLTESLQKAFKMAGRKKVKGSALKHAYEWFLSFTSIGGLSQYSSNDLKVSKLFWLVLFLIGFVLTIVNFIKVIQSILAFGVTISITMEEKIVMPFPAITLCNQNKVHCGNLHNYIESCENCQHRMEALCHVYDMGGCKKSVLAADIFFLGNYGTHDVTEMCSNFTAPLQQ